jgi:hypothetical protein
MRTPSTAATALLVAALAGGGVGAGLHLRHEAYLGAVAADARLRGMDPDSVLDPDTWPQEVYLYDLKRLRDPEAAEELVRADSVRYFVRGDHPTSPLRQAFFFSVGGRSRFLVAEYFPHIHEPVVQTYAAPEPPWWPREAALAWRRKQLAARRAETLGMADTVDLLVADLARARVSFWETRPGVWSYNDTSLLAAELRRFDHVAVRRLIDCLGDARPSATRLSDGRAVPVGAVCAGVLSWVARRRTAESEDAPWAGEYNPVATPEELKAARAAWEEVYRTRTYVLR